MAVAAAEAAVVAVAREVAAMAAAAVEEMLAVVVTVEVLAAAMVVALEVLTEVVDARETGSTALAEAVEMAQVDWVMAAEAAVEQDQSSPARRA